MERGFGAEGRGDGVLGYGCGGGVRWKEDVCRVEGLGEVDQ